MRYWGSSMTALLALGVVGAVTSVATGQAKGNVTTGKALYVTAECLSCHGATGKGDGPKAARMKDKPTDWTTADGGGLKGLNDDKLFEVIANGGRAIGRSRAMPAAPDLSDAQVWDLVAYVKLLAKK